MIKNAKVLYVASSFGHLASFHQPYMEWFSAQGCTVHAAAGGEPCELKGAGRHIQLPFEKSMFSPKNIQATQMLRILLEEEGYTMLSLHTSLAAFFARLAVRAMRGKKPVVMNTVHGYLFDNRTSLPKRMILLQAEKMTAPVTDWLLTMNRQDEEIAQRFHLGKNIVPTRGMGIDLKRFRRPTRMERESARMKLGIGSREIAMVYAAEFSERKNQTLLIRAMQHIPQHVVLLLPGRGKLLERCKELAKQIGVADRIRCPGFAEDIETYYYAADICVSASRSEGLPFNIMEAMACGLPVIASDVKGHEDLVRSGENGMLYPYNDENAFVSAVWELLFDRTRSRMSDAALKAMDVYGLARVMPELTAIYEKAIGDFR